ncbi:uncharacterized protein SPPG_07955 [Spizellomyces punctatus DAOM BR117]|uniref:NADH:ubiquinone oxidoreductase intermediate-associated protein 30 domain-containing protein n=1 Tax=Spizellomyces punctatus (strain DAOM BR117) TaxID=645134 RepID=A0A0L0H6A8_SPIPD|nr:uncharacterized protein SPPG_07955 [Spizellomyces punctatus DAOM BR117]KNC96747.1 hypothetical protein SPPG_07955 [Spizellomyces punctatus DAOM BR117]|eukprot:XP_016604787.1 hypothetical protein SPPG_07955 [Spizellomyces punctatus DAOM BR117]
MLVLIVIILHLVDGIQGRQAPLTISPGLDLFGGTSPWNVSEWEAIDDRVRGGTSESTLELVQNNTVLFKGYVDTEILGGAGFASQRTRGNLMLDLSLYTHLQIQVAASDQRTYSLNLYTSPEKPSYPYSRLTYKYSFNPQGHAGDFSAPWDDFKPFWRGKEVDGPKLDASSIQGLGIMCQSFFGAQEGDFQLVVARISAVVK